MKEIQKNLNPPASLLLSRTDNLGDVVLTLPMAGWIKKFWPQTQVHFLGKTYTKPLIENCRFVDKFWDIKTTKNSDLQTIQAAILVFPEPAAARLIQKIPHRIATTNRWQNWLYSNDLVVLSRRKSKLHEAQLNFKLFAPFQKYGLPNQVSQEQIPELYGLQAPDFKFDFANGSKRIVLHPKSLGSAKDWPLGNYLTLAKHMQSESLYITGTAKEGEAIKAECPQLFDYAKDMTGKLSLSELIGFLAQVDLLLACSTGPLHIAAALGVGALGLFSSVAPIHPGRWKPIGSKAQTIEPQFCPHKTPKNCDCIKKISAQQVFDTAIKILNK